MWLHERENEQAKKWNHQFFDDLLPAEEAEVKAKNPVPPPIEDIEEMIKVLKDADVRVEENVVEKKKGFKKSFWDIRKRRMFIE